MSAQSETAGNGSVWQRARVGVVAAGRYAGEALALLRQHPSLLLFPVLVATFGAVEGGVGNYLSAVHTAYGQWEQRTWARHAKQEKEGPPAAPLVVRLDPRWAVGIAFQEALARATGPQGAPTWSGVQALVPTVMFGDPEHPASGPLVFGRLVFGGIVVAALIVLVLVLNPWLMAGYYGLLGDAVKEGRVEWRRFPAQARRYWLRMIALRALQLAVLGWAMPATFGHQRWLMRFGMAWMSWAGPLVLVLLALAPIVFVMEEAGFWRAVRESVVTIWRKPAVLIALVVGLTAACFVVVEAHVAARGTVLPEAVHASVPSAYLTSIPVAVVYYGVLAALGAWAAVTLFVWRGKAVERESVEGGA